MARKRDRTADSRADLVNAAWQLLLEQGASSLSVEAIAGRAGLSKGTFFHFFPTKQALLDSLCERIADEAWREVGSILARTDLEPIQRLDEYLRVSRSWRLERSKAVGVLWRELSRDENSALMSKVRSLGVDLMAPALAALVKQGKQLGQFYVEDESIVARLIVEWLHATVEGTIRLLGDGNDADAIDTALRRANATLVATERVLGAEEGSLHRVSRDIVEKMASDVPSEDLRIQK